MLEFSPTAPVKPGFHYIFWGYKKVSNTELGKKTQRKNTTKQNATPKALLSQKILLHVNSDKKNQPCNTAARTSKRGSTKPNQLFSTCFAKAESVCQTQF